MKKKNVIVLVLLLVIGFASVSTTLVIKGIFGIGANVEDFNVIFTRAVAEDGGTATISDDGKSITYDTKRLSMVNELAKLDFTVTNQSSQYNANVKIKCVVTNDDANINQYINVDYEPKEEFKLNSNQQKDGFVKTKMIKSFVDDDQKVSFKCDIVADALEKDGNPIEIVSGDGTNVGDEICIGGECFYVIGSDEDNIRMLAKYNLNVGNTADDNATYGIQHEIEHDVIFSNSNGWPKTYNYEAIDIKNQSYGDGPIKDALYGANGYENYLKEYVPTVNVRLITLAELESLGCERGTCQPAPSWVYSVSYWTSSAEPGGANGVYIVRSYGSYVAGRYDYAYYGGVRPVVDIKKNALK